MKLDSDITFGMFLGFCLTTVLVFFLASICGEVREDVQAECRACNGPCSTWESPNAPH